MDCLQRKRAWAWIHLKNRLRIFDFVSFFLSPNLSEMEEKPLASAEALSTNQQAALVNRE